MSTCEKAAKDDKIMPHTHILNTNVLKTSKTEGNNGMTNHKKPYVPIFKSTPANITEPVVGASE